MRTRLPIVVALLLGCAQDDQLSVDIELYNQQGLELLGPLSPADIIEMVVIQSDNPGETQRKADLEIAKGSGKMPSLPVGEGIRIYVRGFRGDQGPEFYGASAPFNVPLDGELKGIPIQIGPTDCLALNESPIRNRLSGGTVDMVGIRTGMTATELADGRILIIGGAEVAPTGDPGTITAAMEVYDPLTSQFFPMGSLVEPRAWHTATRIGPATVLVAGGMSGFANGTASLSGTLQIVDLSGSVPNVVAINGFTAGEDRYRHAATTLNDGSVLLTGGIGAVGAPLASTWRYFPNEFGDPFGGRFEKQGDMETPRSDHAAPALARSNEPAVVGGGLGPDGPLGSIEVFTINPAQMGCPGGQAPRQDYGCWIRPNIDAGERITLQNPRWGHAGISIDGGRGVLWVGGYGSADRTQLVRPVERMDEQLHVLSAGADLPFSGGEQAALELADGNVLVLGGRSGDSPLAGAILMVRQNDPVTRQLSGFAPRELGCVMSEARFGHTAVRLTTGTVLVIGGVSRTSDAEGRGFYLSSRRAEVYFPRVVDLSVVYPEPSIVLP